jgi:hypothetical protein
MRALNLLLALVLATTLHAQDSTKPAGDDAPRADNQAPCGGCKCTAEQVAKGECCGACKAAKNTCNVEKISKLAAAVRLMKDGELAIKVLCSEFSLSADQAQALRLVIRGTQDDHAATVALLAVMAVTQPAAVIAAATDSSAPQQGATEPAAGTPDAPTDDQTPPN